ncbi:unnamed protein product [Mytilus coruscus]|uniref:Uncharacterized protein n=1 Tax=Mytilus coruscus TaxID=42192 RepID=A0A6J8A7W6_MYTCO|nr:unnamed protein product [Mytilus coruscus]
MGDSNRDYTKHGTNPIDFTCVDRDNNNQYIRPGKFTPTNPGWNCNRNPYIQPYSQTAPVFVPQDQDQTTPPSKIPYVSVIVKTSEGNKRCRFTVYGSCTVQPMDGSTFTPPERTYQEKYQKVRKKLSFEPEGSIESIQYCGKDNSAKQSEIHVKRTFNGNTQDVWYDFLRYYENTARLNGWAEERKRIVFLTTLRGQAEAYEHGLKELQKI